MMDNQMFIYTGQKKMALRMAKVLVSWVECVEAGAAVRPPCRGQIEKWIIASVRGLRAGKCRLMCAPFARLRLLAGYTLYEAVGIYDP